MVFQQFYLFPHLTALENVMFGPLRVRGANKAAAENWRKTCWRKWASRNVRTTTLLSFQADSSSAWPLPGRWRLNPK